MLCIFSVHTKSRLKYFKFDVLYFQCSFNYKEANYLASWAERYILIVKRTLYMTLRSELSKDWPHYLPIITKSLNDTPVESLGFLKPSDIKSELDTVKVDEALKLHGLQKRKLPTFQEQNENQQRYEQNPKNILPNSYCYLTFDEKLFDKSFHVSVKLNIKEQLLMVLYALLLFKIICSFQFRKSVPGCRSAPTFRKSRGCRS